MDESSAEDEGQPEEGPSQKKQKLSQAQLGSMGGKVSGKVGENRYKADTYRKSPGSRAKCAECSQPLELGGLYFGKTPPHASCSVRAPRTKWYHLECIFKSFEKVNKETKTITSVDDIEGFEGLDEDVKSRVRELIEKHKVERERRFEKLQLNADRRRKNPNALSVLLTKTQGEISCVTSGGALVEL